MNWLKAKYWYPRLRRTDLQVLWPACRNLAHSLDAAKSAFAVHAYRDPAWLCLGEEEIYRQIEELR
jgi:hypothetical protein